MATVLVGSYSVNTTNNENYVVTFSIPKNCEYQLTFDDGIHTITVCCKTGETEPSKKFITYTETITTSGLLKLDFVQVGCDDNQNLQKPKIRIEF